LDKVEIRACEKLLLFGSAPEGTRLLHCNSIERTDT
jgi:hypothetical protein